MSMSCAHCGLPVAPADRRAGEAVYCCYGCYMVARLVGDKDGQSHRAWHVVRLGIGVFLSMDVMMLSLLLYTRTVEPAAEGAFRWILLGLSIPAMAITVYPMVRGALGEVARRRLSLDTLVTVGSLAALCVSAAHTIVGEGRIYYDTATMLPVLVTFGRLIEASAKTRASALLASLETILPARALRLEDRGADTLSARPAGASPAAVSCEVPLADLRVGDLLRVLPGARIPADGTIVTGNSEVMEAAFTGEAAPRAVRASDEVVAGSINGAGCIEIRAIRVSADMLVRRIVEMVRDAHERPSGSQRLAVRAAASFTPLVLLLAAAAGAGWLIAGEQARAGLAALAVLVVACPCAMGIAAPLATAIGMARAAREGVLVRGGDVMERVGQIGRIFFDKTGTLTLGELTLEKLHACDGADPDEVLACLAAVEVSSEHPLAQAVLREAAVRAIRIPPAGDLRILPSAGIVANVQWGGQTRRVFAGTIGLLKGEFEAGGNLGEYAIAASGLNGGGCSLECGVTAAALQGACTTVFVGWEGRCRGWAAFADSARPEAAGAVAHLRRLGVQTTLLSGDRAEAAIRVGGQMGIDEVLAPRRSDEKLQEIRDAAATGVTAMVGDGINDAPALAQADVGIAMAGGTDLARLAGNVVLLGNRLESIPWLLALSRQTRRIIRQNLAWALGYNAIALAAAATGYLPPLLAAVAMVVSSLTVLSNSVKLNRFPKQRKNSSTDYTDFTD